MSTRVLFGSLKGKTIASVPNSVVASSVSLRPTMSMVRSVIFNTLQHNPVFLDRAIGGSVVLDLCCGCGIVGIEFLSMGATSVTFIDRSLPAIKLLKENLHKLALLGKARIEKKRLPSVIVGKFDTVFLDPPYMDLKLALEQMVLLRKNENLNVGALIIVETDKSNKVNNVDGFELMFEKKVNGKAKLAFFCLSD